MQVQKILCVWYLNLFQNILNETTHERFDICNMSALSINKGQRRKYINIFESTKHVNDINITFY